MQLKTLESADSAQQANLIDDWNAEVLVEQSAYQYNLPLFAEHFFKEKLTMSVPVFHRQILSAMQQRLLSEQPTSYNISTGRSKGEGVGGEGTPPFRPRNKPSNFLLSSTTQSYDSPLKQGQGKLAAKSTTSPDARKKSASKNRHLALVMPREFSKSTLAMIAVLWCILYAHKRFVLYVSKSADGAAELVKPIRHELEHNVAIKAVFGEMKSDKWTERLFELKNETAVQALGRGGQIRGQKFLWHRPGLVILDDIEDDKEVENKMLREETEEWLAKQVLKGVDSGTGNVFAIGTILHPDSLLANIAVRKERRKEFTIFDKLVFAALDEDDKSIWEEKFPTESLLKEKDMNYRSFMQERMNQPIPAGSGEFKKANFRYYELFDKDNLKLQDGTFVSLSSCNIYITVDPAASTREKADYTVIMASAISPNNDIFVLEYLREKYEEQSRTIDGILHLAEKWKVDRIGVESVAFQRWLIGNLRAEMKKRDKFYSAVELKADKDKVRRISALEPRFAAHSVYFRNHMSDLEEELLLFPKAPHDDLPDALAYVPRLGKAPAAKEKKVNTAGTFDWWGSIRDNAINPRWGGHTGSNHEKWYEDGYV